MSLRVRLILLWALSSLLVIFLLFITGFLIFRRFSPTDQEILIEVLFPFRFHLLLPLVFLVLALIWGAKWFLEKYWFPLERMLEELELVRTVNSSLRIQTQGSTQLKALAAKLNQMAANTELTQQEIKKNIEQATRSLEEEKHLFEALLEHLPTGVIVTNSEGHLLLYNHQAQQLLEEKNGTKPGLGRDILKIFESTDAEQVFQEMRIQSDEPDGIPERSFFLGRNGGSLKVTAHAVMNQHHLLEGLLFYLEEEAQAVESPDSQFVSSQSGNKISNHVRLRNRPIYYDFDLFQKSLRHPELNDVSIRDLNYTVFDTETTGLDPRGGDEIISIGALRIINRNILFDERFEQLIDPNRKISKASIAIHGIQPQVLEGCPTIDKVLPDFRSFCSDSVLVGHNVAFDMSFLKMKEVQTGIVFNNPVLDTLLLSAVVHPTQELHSLDSIADRLELEIDGRHTALGDAVVTAQIFLALLTLLEERGIFTLNQAFEASQKTHYARLRY